MVMMTSFNIRCFSSESHDCAVCSASPTASIVAMTGYRRYGTGVPRYRTALPHMEGDADEAFYEAPELALGGPGVVEDGGDVFYDAPEAPSDIGDPVVMWETVAGSNPATWLTATMIDELLLEELEDTGEQDNESLETRSEAPSISMSTWSRRTGASSLHKNIEPEVVDAMMEELVENRRLLDHAISAELQRLAK